MKANPIIIIIFLNLFCKLASAQWIDDALLLRDSDSQSIVIKKKKSKLRSLPTPEHKKEPLFTEEELRKPNQVLSIPEVLELKPSPGPQSNIDLWVGFRKMDQASKFIYKNFKGETPVVGVKASAIFNNWSWFLLYDTGFYYQIVSKSHLRLRDENLQVGFLNKLTDLPWELYYGVSAFENTIVNENLNTDFIGNKKSGVSILFQKAHVVDESMVFVFGLSLSPLIIYKETTSQHEINSGRSASVMMNALQFGVAEKLDENDSLLLNASFNWTEVQFGGVSSVVDPGSNEFIQGVRVHEENYNFQIGYRWGI
jgi:hypothetical protein